MIPEVKTIYFSRLGDNLTYYARKETSITLSKVVYFGRITSNCYSTKSSYLQTIVNMLKYERKNNK